MKRTLIILLTIILCLSAVALTACGCQHYYENGVCVHCGEPDANYDPNNATCVHYYNNGACIGCGDVDPNYVANADGEERNAISLRKAGTYGVNGQQVSITGTVFAVDTNGYYINDGTASMFVADTMSVNVGDVVFAKVTLTVDKTINKVSATATETEVLLSGTTALQPSKNYVSEFAKLPMVASNYYCFMHLVGLVEVNDGVYSLELNGSHIEIDQASNAVFQNYVGQKLTATVVVVGYTNTWVVKTVTANPIDVEPADLDSVAETIFAWAQTQLPTETFANFEVPTAYALEPTVEFAWSVTGVSGIEVQNNLVVLNAVDGETTIPLTLTLSCNGKTKTNTYNVKVKADFVFDWAQAQLPTKAPLQLNLPTSYNGEGNITFEWSVEQGNAIEVASNVLKVVPANATQDTTCKLRLTIKSGNLQLSKVIDINVPANGTTTYAEIASLPVDSIVKINGTIIAKGYDNGSGSSAAPKEYGITIVSEDKQLFTATCTSQTQWQGYTIGDQVEVTGGVFKRYDSYTGKTVYRMSVSCDDVTVVQPAPSNFKVDLTGINVVTLETLTDYQNLVTNFQEKTGNTIVKIVNPYMTSSSGSAAGNFIRFGPNASAKDGYSVTANGKTYKREFTLFRALYQEIDKTSYDKFVVPFNSKGCTQNMVEIYAVIMFMGDTSWQFVPLGADFTTFAQA